MILHVIGTVTVFLVHLTAALDACPYLDSAPPVVYELPLTALTQQFDLPLEFIGLSGVVTRRRLPVGSKPTVTVTKYTSTPSIAYDSMLNKVTVSMQSCGGGGSAASAAVSARNAITTYLLLGLAAMYNPSTSVLGVALISAAYVVTADESCSQSVQVVVEAPSSYQGAVEVCNAEVSEKGHCPDAFPTFATCDDPAPSCGVAVVGAGVGGLYAALRYVVEYLCRLFRLTEEY